MKQTITLAMGGGEPMALQVDADVLDGLAVHRWQGIRNADWQITHVKSGMALGAPYRLRSTAYKAREQLLKLGEWDLEQDELCKWLDHSQEARDIIKATHDAEAAR